MSEQKIELVPLQFIKPLPGNTTRIGREEDYMLRTDMTRIESRGLYKIDPILLRRLTPEEIQEIRPKYPFAMYELIDGHSRWNAARELGWNQIRAVIIDATREEARAINYMKNKARGNVDPLREALYFKHLHEDQKMTQEKIAEKFGIDQSYVSKILKRIKISKEASRTIMTRVIPGRELSGKHLEVIASVSEPQKQAEIAQRIMDERLSWRQAEEAKKALDQGLPIEEAVKVAKAPTEKVEKIETDLQVECPVCHETLTLVHAKTHKLVEVKG